MLEGHILIGSKQRTQRVSDSLVCAIYSVPTYVKQVSIELLYSMQKHVKLHESMPKEINYISISKSQGSRLGQPTYPLITQPLPALLNFPPDLSGGLSLSSAW